MASGFFPLSRTYSDYGKALAKIADDLRALSSRRGDQYSRAGLPAAWENDQTDNAASDGGYETYLDLALELIERCLEPKPKAAPSAD